MSVILFTCFFIRLGIYTDNIMVLMQVYCSVSTDSSNMAQLHEWNELFGEGGSRKKPELSYFMQQSNLILYRNGYTAIDANSFQTHIINLQILSHFRSIHLTRCKLILLVRNSSHCNFLHDRVICKVDKLWKR